MDAVFGEGPLARSLAVALGRFGNVLLVSGRPVLGPFFWQKGSLATGEGIKPALRAARRAFVILHEPHADPGVFFSLLKPDMVARGVVAVPLDAPAPDLKKHPDWSVVQVGPTWGPEEPLVAAWASSLAEGRRIWIADPGVMHPVAMDDAVAALRAAAGFRGLRWTIAGEEEARLPDLVATIADGLGVPPKVLPVPTSLAARRAGIPLSRIDSWLRSPVERWHTPGWNPPELVGREGWLGAPELWTP